MCFKEVSGVCWEHFKSVSRKLLGLIRSVFKGVWSKLQTSFEVVSRVFPEGFKQVLGYFMEVSRVFSSNIFSRILWKFQESYKKMLKVLHRSFILHVTHRSYLSRRRGCFSTGPQRTNSSLQTGPRSTGWRTEKCKFYFIINFFKNQNLKVSWKSLWAFFV